MKNVMSRKPTKKEKELINLMNLSENNGARFNIERKLTMKKEEMAREVSLSRLRNL